MGILSLSANLVRDSSTPHQEFICCQVMAWTILKHFGPLASSPDGKRYLRHFNWHEHYTNFCATNNAILQPVFMPTTSRGAWNSLYAIARDSFPPGMGMSS